MRPTPWTETTHGTQPANNFKQVPFEDYDYARRCVNACEGKSISDIQLSTLHREQCIKWERMMMELVGEDGLDSVRQAIDLEVAIIAQLRKDDKEIREIIDADPNEATTDDVRRLFSKLKLQRDRLVEAAKNLENDDGSTPASLWHQLQEAITFATT